MFCFWPDAYAYRMRGIRTLYYRFTAVAALRLFNINASLRRQIFLGFITYLTIKSDYHLNTQWSDWSTTKSQEKHFEHDQLLSAGNQVQELASLLAMVSLWHQEKALSNKAEPFTCMYIHIHLYICYSKKFYKGFFNVQQHE